MSVENVDDFDLSKLDREVNTAAKKTAAVEENIGRAQKRADRLKRDFSETTGAIERLEKKAAKRTSKLLLRSVVTSLATDALGEIGGDAARPALELGEAAAQGFIAGGAPGALLAVAIKGISELMQAEKNTRERVKQVNEKLDKIKMELREKLVEQEQDNRKRDLETARKIEEMSVKLAQEAKALDYASWQARPEFGT